MPRDLVRTGSLVLALLGATALSAGTAVAQQQQPPAAEPQQQQQQEKAQQTPSGQMGKEEPSSHAPSAKPADNSVFVNGALAVPGAPENTDTVPAKFSEQNAAGDKLSIAAYTFKLLTEEQRRAIYTGLKGQPAGPAFNADIGAELPSSVELRPMPDDVVARVQQTKDYRYAVADNRVLLVSPVSRYVVGIFVDDVQAPAKDAARRSMLLESCTCANDACCFSGANAATSQANGARRSGPRSSDRCRSKRTPCGAVAAT